MKERFSINNNNSSVRLFACAQLLKAIELGLLRSPAYPPHRRRVPEQSFVVNSVEQWHRLPSLDKSSVRRGLSGSRKEGHCRLIFSFVSRNLLVSSRLYRYLGFLAIKMGKRTDKQIYLFYCAECEELARKVCDQSDAIQLCTISWRSPSHFH